MAIEIWWYFIQINFYTVESNIRRESNSILSGVNIVVINEKRVDYITQYVCEILILSQNKGIKIKISLLLQNQEHHRVHFVDMWSNKRGLIKSWCTTTKKKRSSSYKLYDSGIKISMPKIPWWFFIQGYCWVIKRWHQA